MRVIAGKAGSIRLKALPGDNTRPTTDRVKETLFNIMAPYIADARFLDFFSGSGAIAIEALSRGASEAVLIERNRKAVEIIQGNLRAAKLEEHARILNEDALLACDRLKDEGAWDIIFMDPPYRMDWEQKLLKKLRNSALIDENTLIVVEASADTDFSYLKSYGYQCVKKKTYGSNLHMFLKVDLSGLEGTR